MLTGLRRTLCLLATAGLFAGSAGGAEGASATEEKRTEEMKILRLEAANARLALRVIAGAREIEILDPHTLSVHDTAEKLTLVRQVVVMLDRPDSAEEPAALQEVGDGTTLASFALRHAEPNKALRMLMSEIGIRRVASVEEISTVVVRDTAAQVEKALVLLQDFDRAAP